MGEVVGVDVGDGDGDDVGMEVGKDDGWLACVAMAVRNSRIGVALLVIVMESVTRSSEFDVRRSTS